MDNYSRISWTELTQPKGVEFVHDGVVIRITYFIDSVSKEFFHVYCGESLISSIQIYREIINIYPRYSSALSSALSLTESSCPVWTTGGNQRYVFSGTTRDHIIDIAYSHTSNKVDAKEQLTDSQANELPFEFDILDFKCIVDGSPLIGTLDDPYERSEIARNFLVVVSIICVLQNLRLFTRTSFSDYTLDSVSEILLIVVSILSFFLIKKKQMLGWYLAITFYVLDVAKHTLIYQSFVFQSYENLLYLTSWHAVMSLVLEPILIYFLIWGMLENRKVSR